MQINLQFCRARVSSTESTIVKVERKIIKLLECFAETPPIFTIYCKILISEFGIKKFD